jgi:hypothetical protein
VDQSAILRIRTLRVVNKLRSAGTKKSDKEPGSKLIESHLIVSDGVTAKTASIIPAPNPALKTQTSDMAQKRSACTRTHQQGSLARSLYPHSGQNKHSRPDDPPVRTHLGIRQHALEMVVANEPHAGLRRVSDHKRRASRIQARRAFGTKGIADDGDGALPLHRGQPFPPVMRKNAGRTLPPNWDRVLANSAGYVMKLHQERSRECLVAYKRMAYASTAPAIAPAVSE